MGLFDKFKKEEKVAVEFPITMKATAEGELVAMKDIPDPVFSQGMVGPCVGIEPSKGTVAAPCDGKISTLSDTLHAFGMEVPGGVQLLVHIGIDTVNMKGEGFKAFVKAGDTVKAGQPIVEVDLDKVREAGHPTVIMTIVPNAGEFKNVSFKEQGQVAFSDDLITIEN